MTRIHPTTESGVDVEDTTSNIRKNSEIQEVTFSPPVYDDEDEDAPKQMYELSILEKIINYMLCRADLATQKLENKPVSILELFRFANRTDWIIIILGLLCAICAGISQPALCIISGRIINVLLVYPPRSTKFRDKGYENVYIFLGLGGFYLFINFFQYFFFQTACNRIIARMKRNYVASIIRQNAGWFDKHQSGVLTTVLNDNIERIREGIGEKLGLLLRGIVMLIASLIVSFIYEWRLTFVMIGITPCCCFAMSILSQKMETITFKELEDLGKAGAIAEEAILGVRTVQACNGQEETVEKYATELNKGRKYGIEKSYWAGFLTGLFFFFLYLFIGVGCLYGGWLLKVGVFSNPGDIFVCIYAMLVGAYFLGLASPHLMAILNARVAAATIYQTIDRVPRIDAYSDVGERPPNPVGHVIFKDVHFRYPTRKNAKILNGLNLTIEPGQTVALVGHSGCGKSTTVGLLTRLYEPEAGSVTIDGIDVRKYNINYLRHVCGIVQQEPVLFNATIAENIRIGFPECTRERMIEVCKMANAHDFIKTLPNGYDTLIGDGGVQLSGGQKQRIAIARTLARDPKVLLLDEATSALDAQSESVVQSALDNAAKGRSTIMIAHRLSTIRNADKIVVFEKGEIAEQGTHAELVALGGRYAALVKAQQFVPDDESEATEEVDLGDPPKRAKIATYDFPPEFEPVETHKFDDISRKSSASSSQFGRQAFVRGASINSSTYRSSRSGVGIGPGAVDTIRRTPDDIQNFIADVPRNMEEDDNNNYSIITVYKNAKGEYLKIILGIFITMIQALQLPGAALAFTYLFESFQYASTDPGKMMNRCVRTLGIYIGIGAGAWLSIFLSSVFLGHASENLITKFRIAAFRNILYQDAGYFDDPAHTAGKLITRLASDAPNVKAVIDSRLIQVIQGITSVGVAIIIAFIYAWQIALLGILIVLALGGSTIFTAYKVMMTNMTLAKEDEAGRISIEIIENVRTIQLLTREPYFNNQFSKAVKTQKKAEMQKCFYESLNNSITQTSELFLYAVCFALGIAIIYKGQKNTSDTFQGVMAIGLAAVAIMESFSYFPEFVNANSSAKLLFSMIFRKPETGDSSVGERAEIRGNILFEHVKFTYPQKSNLPIMVDLNFTALRGQTVALVGPSGCGKSTTISMLERFYDVAGGALRIDGKDIRNLCLDHLRTQIALVGQEPRLFAGTIRENVMFGVKGKVTEDQINKALDLANARRFINNLPAGIETEVGEKGTQMSGGQKQRIAIARALIRDPKILLLDEATSALDSESEKAVQEALDKAREGRTCITIAHRLSSIQNADVILYIEDGRVQEAGNHQTLMQKKGKYYSLIRKQDLTS